MLVKTLLMKIGWKLLWLKAIQNNNLKFSEYRLTENKRLGWYSYRVLILEFCPNRHVLKELFYIFNVSRVWLGEMDVA